MKTKEPKREVEVINSSMSSGDANFSFNDNRTVTEDHNLLRSSLITKDVPTDRNMPSKMDSLEEFPSRQLEI